MASRKPSARSTSSRRNGVARCARNPSAFESSDKAGWLPPLKDAAGTLPMSADTNRCDPSSGASSQSTPPTCVGTRQSDPFLKNSRRMPVASLSGAT